MMTYYFRDFSFRLIYLKFKGNQVYLFSNVLPADSAFITVLRKIPYIRTKLNNLVQEPDVHIGDFKGLYYRLNLEALECAEFVCNRLKLEDCQFVRVYNEKFNTDKVKPFVLKWISYYVFDLFNCLYRISLDKPSQKVLYLHDNLLNRYIYEWWSQKTGYEIPIKWLKKKQVQCSLEAMAFVAASFGYRLLSRGLCLQVKPRKFKVLLEAAWGLRNSLFRDDFFIDNKTLFKRDLLLYSTGGSEAGRMLAWKDAQNSEYECINIVKLKIQLSLLFRRLIKYHLLLPIALIFRNFGNQQSHLIAEWLPVFHGAATNYEILLSHYQIGLELDIDETGLNHIPETIILNNYGAKNVIFHWSDMTSYDSVGEKYKTHNIYLIWGNMHYDFHKRLYFIDKVIQTGLIFNSNFSELTANKLSIYEKIGLRIDGHKVLAFYDESYGPGVHFTEETFLDFWQMMYELIDERKDVIGILKPKWLGYKNMSDNAKDTFDEIRERCRRSGRFYVIDPLVISVTEIIAISNINITMGMCSPSTIALLCGKIGLYYDTTGNDQHPFRKKYRNKVAFNDKRDLFLAVSKILDEGYNPLDEIEPALLKGYDHFRDQRGLQRFREALLKNQ